MNLTKAAYKRVAFVVLIKKFLLSNIDKKNSEMKSLE